MNRRLFLAWLAGLIGIVILLPHVAYSDVYMKQKQHIDAISTMGQNQPARDLTVETWITENKMVSNNEQQKILINMDNKTITFANHAEKTITTMPLDFSKMTAGKEDMSAEDKAAFQQFMGKMMDIKVNIQPTAEKKKINGWNCVKYIQTLEMAMGTVTSEIWASTDIKIDEDLYAKFSAAMMAQMPGVSQNMSTLMNEMKKIKGVHVLTSQTTKMMGQSFGSSTELMEYKQGKAPASAFNMPAGYQTKNPF